MRDYGKVHTSFWTSTTTRDMSEDARTLALYLITSPHSTIAGVFRLPDGYACEDLQWPSERVEKGFDELLIKGFANRCGTTKWVWVLKHLEWNPPENPNQRKSASKIAMSVPSECGWKPMFMRDCWESLGLSVPVCDEGCETLVEGLANQEQEQEQKQDSPSLRSGESAGKPATPRPKSELKTLKSYLDACKASGIKPLPADHPVRDYCRDAGISDDMLAVAWCVFRDDYTTGTSKSKKYKDWPGHFANAVRGCWAKLWYTDGSTVAWTSRGQQEKAVLDARAKSKGAGA